MNKLRPQNEIPLKWLIGLLAFLLLIILAAGLKPRGFRFVNRVGWIGDRPGIQFGGYGIAHTDPFDDRVESGQPGANEFSLEIALKPADYRGRRFKIVLALHNGEDGDQLVLGQYHSWLIAMNGDDYANRKKANRISVDAAAPSPVARFVTVTSGQEGTKIFFDGNLAGARKDFKLKIPIGENIRLLAGNSVYARHPWKGDIYGLALYRRAIDSREVALHFRQWSKGQTFSFARDDGPFALYYFDEKRGPTALDHSGANRHLKIPFRMQVLEKRVLAFPWENFNFNTSFMIDAIVNFAGFIPFGFILLATVTGLGGAFGKHAVSITVMLCFAVSCSIEILQASIPSRSSHMLDLVLNTAGGWTGAAGCRILGKVKRKRSKI